MLRQRLSPRQVVGVAKQNQQGGQGSYAKISGVVERDDGVLLEAGEPGGGRARAKLASSAAIQPSPVTHANKGGIIMATTCNYTLGVTFSAVLLL